MSIPGSKADGKMIADVAQFDLTREIADLEQQKPSPSAMYAKTLYGEMPVCSARCSVKRGRTVSFAREGDKRYEFKHSKASPHPNTGRQP